MNSVYDLLITFKCSVELNVELDVYRSQKWKDVNYSVYWCTALLCRPRGEDISSHHEFLGEEHYEERTYGAYPTTNLG